ncbi:MAG: succinylglutamate desuccinylase/aspartoacylase family protein [Firmicutes bacterium]|nr:succinylglutamate desuccinylase/aspartoacylase family protein [Bacillota bacterium]
MIETFASVSLPIDEKYKLTKQRIQNGTSKKRICVVTGIHGDELEGQYVAYQLQQKIREVYDQLDGIVDIYPCMNPLGMDSIQRKVPMFDLDMNRIFPGDEDGSMVEYLAYCIIQDIKGADLVIDIHASNAYLVELPQLRINELFKEKLVPMSKWVNANFVWIHSTSTILESTLGYCLNKLNTPTLVLEMGIGSRLTLEYGENSVQGLLNAMHQLGMLKNEYPVMEPIIGYDQEIRFLNAQCAGLFISEMEVNTPVKKGQVIGMIVDPLSGNKLCEVISDWDGLLFTIRKYPICNEGSLIGRILEGKQ